MNVMRKIAIAVFSIVSAAGITCGAANAQATRTWVSGVGDDANPCSRTAPCKTFAGTISKTAAGGEIDCLDPGGFGALTITKAITIDCNGVTGGVLNSGSNGIVINAGVNDKIFLKNLYISGVGNGLDGIRFLSGAQLSLENVHIYGNTGDGIDVSKTATGELYVTNTYITNVANGIVASTTGGFIIGALNNVTIANATTDGLVVSTNNVFLTLENTTIASAGQNGVHISAGTGQVNIDDSTIVNNTTGVRAASTGSRVRISNSNVYNNTVGIFIGAGATVASTGNNRIDGNGSTTAPNAAITVQ